MRNGKQMRKEKSSTIDVLGSRVRCSWGHKCNITKIKQIASSKE